MSITKNELELIKRQQLDFEGLVQDCNREELGQCAKLLAMHIAVYKQQYGEIPVKNLAQIAETVSVNQEISQVIQNGIEEASDMLRMVRNEQRRDKSSFYCTQNSNSIN